MEVALRRFSAPGWCVAFQVDVVSCFLPDVTKRVNTWFHSLVFSCPVLYQYHTSYAGKGTEESIDFQCFVKKQTPAHVCMCHTRVCTKIVVHMHLMYEHGVSDDSEAQPSGMHTGTLFRDDPSLTTVLYQRSDNTFARSISRGTEARSSTSKLCCQGRSWVHPRVSCANMDTSGYKGYCCLLLYISARSTHHISLT